MNHSQVRALLDIVLTLSPDCLDRDQLGDAVQAASQLESFLAHYKMRCARRGNELAAEGRSENGFGLIASEGHHSTRDAHAAVDRDRVCAQLPELDQALAAGAVSGDHVDIVAKHTKGLTDEQRSELSTHGRELAAAAAVESTWLFERHTKQLIEKIRAAGRPDSDVDQLERQKAASKISRRTDRESGMKTTVIELDPLRDAQLHTRINAHLARLRQDPANKGRPFQQLYVEALMAAVTEPAATSIDGGDGGGEGHLGGLAIPDVIVHIDAASACAGRHADTLCETQDGDPLPVATVQRLCCEAAITTVVIDPDGTTTRIYEERTANRRQRRALAAIYATCAHPDCQVPFSQCRIHHIVWWTNGGPTVLANMIPVCETHHHLLHEGGWSLEIDPDRTVRWKRPDGTLWREHHSPNRHRRTKRQTRAA